MMKSVLNWLSGWQTVFVPHEHAVEVLNLLHDENLLSWHMKNTEDGGLSFRMLLPDARRFLARFPFARGDRECGLPSLLHRYRGRWGILVGALLFAVLVWQSTTVVWEVSVNGNEKLPDKEIVSMLSEFGFGVGTRFRKIDFDVLQNDFLLTTDEIAWIAVNMEGTVAHVEVRENLGSRSRGESGSPAANLIAAEDGQIFEIRLVSGGAAVQRGDIVRKGDLLISGLLTIGEDGLRYEYAKGEVLAQVNRVIEAESPLVRTKTVFTGAEKTKKTVRIFAKEIKLFRNTGIEYTTYDTIITDKQVSLPGGISLPICITTETVLETAVETVTVTEEEAFADAMILYQKEMERLLRDAEILEIETERIFEDGVCRIVGRAVCIADIAETAEIGIH